MPKNFVAITVKERGNVPRRLRRELDKGIGAGLRATAEDHHKTNVPKRFTQEHARKARYVRRARQYEQRKQREGRDNLPMVYTGRSRARASVAKIVSTNKRARLSYSMPALNFLVGPPGRTRTMRSEFEKVLYHEKQRGERIATRATATYLRQNRTTTTRRIL